MKKFLVNVTKFFALFILVLTIIESYLYYYPSSFRYKYTFLQNNNNNIEVLVLGSSHNHRAINPEFITDFVTSNLAFDRQDLTMDYYLLTTYIDHLPKLKYVVLNITYDTLESKLGSDDFKNSLYLRFHGINNFNRRLNPKDYSMFLQRPKYYLLNFFPFLNHTKINVYGAVTNTGKDDFLPTQNGILSDKNSTVIPHHANENPAHYDNNVIVLKNLLTLCKKHNLTPVLITPPVTASHFNAMIPEKRQRRDAMIPHLLELFPHAQYFNFETDTRFTVSDFMDSSHLNPRGAEKFSSILNSILGTL